MLVELKLYCIISESGLCHVVKILSSIRLIFITRSLSACLNFMAVGVNDDIVGDLTLKGNAS